MQMQSAKAEPKRGDDSQKKQRANLSVQGQQDARQKRTENHNIPWCFHSLDTDLPAHSRARYLC